MNAKLEELRIEAIALCNRIVKQKTEPGDFVDLKQVKLDGDASWVVGMINSRTLHEPDFAVFGKFSSEEGTILDVGANWGYSIGSIRASGSNCPILSFEVLSGYEASLRTARDYLKKDFDYVMTGLGSKSASLVFLTPTVGNSALTALTTANWQNFTDENIHGIVTNIVNYAGTYMRSTKDLRPAFLRTEARIEKLDVLLAEFKGNVKVDKIAAIKIDVEGLEADVLLGGEKTILKHLPFLMLEGGNRDPAVDKITKKWGYELAEFENGQLLLASGYSKAANGYFVHPTKVASYQKRGIVVSSS
jgi:FkbM family methyltransferase